MIIDEKEDYDIVTDYLPQYGVWRVYDTRFPGYATAFLRDADIEKEQRESEKEK